MKKATKTTAILIAIMMMLTVQMGVFAQEQVQVISAPVEQPSEWAVESVVWSAIYGLAEQEMYSKYASKVTREELYSVCGSVYEKLTGDMVTPIDVSPFSDTNSEAVRKAYAADILNGTGEFGPESEVSRLEMVTALYNTIKSTQPDFNYEADINLAFSDAGEISGESLGIIKYAVSKGILKGRSNDVLDLDSICSRQELMVFAKNVYEFVIYESNSESKGAFWKVSDEDSTIYLLGSIHMADPSLYPLSKAILSAYEESDAMAVEADIANSQEGVQYMQQMMMYADENTLDQKIPQDLYERFVEFIKPLNIPAEMYNKFKPWYAAMLAQTLQLTDNAQGGANLSANLGVDIFILEKATGKKEFIEIEGMKFQIDMFDSFSDELQLSYLKSVLSPESEVQEQSMDVIAKIMEYWKKGNMEELAKLLETGEDDSEEGKEFNEKLWLTRNNNMTQKAREYLADPSRKTYFIIVGAGHMVGETGIVTQLQDEYTIEQIK